MASVQFQEYSWGGVINNAEESLFQTEDHHFLPLDFYCYSKHDVNSENNVIMFTEITEEFIQNSLNISQNHGSLRNVSQNNAEFEKSF